MVLVFAAHSADRLRVDRDLLRQAFGLSRSEADIAFWLAAGEGAEAISAHREGTLAKVRTQIKHVMRKLGVRRQSELVSLVASGLAALRREEGGECRRRALTLPPSAGGGAEGAAGGELLSTALCGRGRGPHRVRYFIKGRRSSASRCG